MKGLFIKDLLLIKNQKRTLPLLLLCGIIMAVTLDSPMAAVIYLTILGAMVSAGTLSYDELDHGYAYLFTLPVSRKAYVREKYLFSVCCCIVSMLLGLIICLIVTLVKGGGVSEPGSFSAGALLTVAITLGCLLPARIKYGTEKSSIVLFIVFGLAAAVVVTVSKAGQFLPEPLAGIISGLLAHAQDTVMILVILLLSAAILLISEQISERIIAGKEY